MPSAIFRMSLESVEAQPGKYSAHQKPQPSASSANVTANTRAGGHAEAEAPATSRKRAKPPAAGEAALRTGKLSRGGTFVE